MYLYHQQLKLCLAQNFDKKLVWCLCHCCPLVLAIEKHVQVDASQLPAHEHPHHLIVRIQSPVV